MLPRRLVAISACQTVVQLHVEEQGFITRLSAMVVVNNVKLVFSLQDTSSCCRQLAITQWIFTFVGGGT